MGLEKELNQYFAQHLGRELTEREKHFIKWLSFEQQKTKTDKKT